MSVESFFIGSSFVLLLLFVIYFPWFQKISVTLRLPRKVKLHSNTDFVKKQNHAVWRNRIIAIMSIDACYHPFLIEWADRKLSWTIREALCWIKCMQSYLGRYMKYYAGKNVCKLISDHARSIMLDKMYAKLSWIFTTGSVLLSLIRNSNC